MKKTILIADDEEAIRESLSLYLQEENFDCQCAMDAEETIEKSCNNRFDLIILDLRMPHARGFDVVKKIKECRPDTPVLIITAYYEMEQAAEALVHGASKMVIKPLDFVELLEEIEALIGDD